MTGDIDFDDDGFGDANVEGRQYLRELERVMDEREQTTTTHPTKSDNCEAWELKLARVDSEFRFLDTSNDNIVVGKGNG